MPTVFPDWSLRLSALRRLLSLARSASAIVFLGLAFLPQSASAVATFELVLSGPAILECPPFNADCGYSHPFQWRGTVTLVTSSSADGIYSGEGFLFLDVNSNLFVATSNGLGFINGEPSDVVPASVTLLNGQVTSFDFYYDAPFELAVFGGLHATYEAHADRTGTHIQATAVLASVPEPATLSLMLAGLLLTRVVQRSRKRRDSATPWRHARQPASAFATN